MDRILDDINRNCFLIIIIFRSLFVFLVIAILLLVYRLLFWFRINCLFSQLKYFICSLCYYFSELIFVVWKENWICNRFLIMSNGVITFQPFHTFIDPSFWSTLNYFKINEWKLDTSVREVVGTFTTCKFF